MRSIGAFHPQSIINKQGSGRRNDCGVASNREGLFSFAPRVIPSILGGLHRQIPICIDQSLCMTMMVVKDELGNCEVVLCPYLRIHHASRRGKEAVHRDAHIRMVYSTEYGVLLPLPLYTVTLTTENIHTYIQSTV